jgi:hypothetical protein
MEDQASESYDKVCPVRWDKFSCLDRGDLFPLLSLIRQ